MKHLMIMLSMVLALSSLTCASMNDLLVEGKVPFFGYGLSGIRTTDPDKKKEAAQRAALMDAQARLIEALKGTVFVLEENGTVTAEFAGLAGGKHPAEYRELAAGVQRCLLLADPSLVNYRGWGTTRRLGLELSFQGDWPRAKDYEISRFLGSISGETMKAIVKDAETQGLVRDRRLVLSHLYIHNDITDGGTARVTVIYAADRR